MSTVEKYVAIILLVLVFVEMYAPSTTANDLQDNRCHHKSKWLKCGPCCQRAKRSCRLHCKGCKPYPGDKNKDPCYVHRNNTNYMKYFYLKGCGQKCGIPKQIQG